VRHTIITLLLRLKVPMDPVYRAALEQSAHRRHLRIPGRERSPTVPNRALPFCSTGIPERRPITWCRSSRAPGMNEGRRPGSLRARRLQHMRDHLNAYRIPCSAVAAAAHWKNGRRSLGPAWSGACRSWASGSSIRASSPAFPARGASKKAASRSASSAAPARNLGKAVRHRRAPRDRSRALPSV